MKGIRTYKFDYDNIASLTIEVDLNLFTEETAKSTLGFFIWDYDKEGDQIDAVMKKYALAILQESTNSSSTLNVKGMIERFKNEEGFAYIDGSMGLTLKSLESYEFQEEVLDMSVSEYIHS